jgi:hypothetical protein
LYPEYRSQQTDPRVYGVQRYSDGNGAKYGSFG